MSARNQWSKVYRSGREVFRLQRFTRDGDESSQGRGERWVWISLVLVAGSCVSAAHASIPESWSRTGTVARPLGTEICLADLDGDGWSDLVVVTPEWIGVDIHAGSGSGFDPLPTWSLGSPDLSLEFGASLSADGDLDGDGRIDLVVGAPAPFGANVRGAAWIWTGLTDEPVEVRSSWIGDRFGAEVASIDTDGNGIAELFVGAPAASEKAIWAGRVDEFVLGPQLSIVPRRSMDGDLAGDGFGSMIVSPGDLNHDGYDEILVGAPDASRGQNREGLVLLFAGGEEGWSQTPVWREQGDEDFGYFGYAATGVGDMDGNGAEELLVGGWGFEAARGEVRLFEWAGHDLSQGQLADSWVGERTVDFFGVSLAGGMDVNGDGHLDCGVGAPGADSGGESAGEVLWLSRAEGSFAEVCRTLGEPGEQLGAAVAVKRRGARAAWSASAPWALSEGIRVGRVIAGRDGHPVLANRRSKPGTGAEVPDESAGLDRPTLRLSSNPLAANAEVLLRGLSRSEVDVAFLDVTGRTIETVRWLPANSNAAVPFPDPGKSMPRTGWVRVRQGGFELSKRWVR